MANSKSSYPKYLEESKWLTTSLHCLAAAAAPQDNWQKTFPGLPGIPGTSFFHTLLNCMKDIKQKS